LRLAGEAEECEINIRWQPPADDGGAAIEDYEVSVFEAVQVAPTTEVESPQPSEALLKSARTSECAWRLAGLTPGAGPYRFEVRACSSFGLVGPATAIELCTAVAAPDAPTALRARLLPPLRRRGSEASSSGLAAEGPASNLDVDVVRLEWRAPAEEGGRRTESFLIYAIEEDLEEEATEKPQCAKAADSGPAPIHSAMASEVAAGGVKPGGACMCDVRVEPGKAYAFFVEAHNGALPSNLSDPSASVFIPARVPYPPEEPPEVFRVEGGFAAELRWVGPLRGGGLPLHSYRVGILKASDVTEDGLVSSIAREVTVSCAAAAAAAQDSTSIQWQPPRLLGENEVVYAVRIDGLQADAKHCFVLAASNAMGTGQWSRPSSPLMTPLAAPPAPVNAVATVMLDDKQRVVVTVQWDNGRQGANSGAVAAFQVMLIPVAPAAPAASSSASLAVDNTVLRERILVSCAAGRRFDWSAPLPAPGNYAVEIVAESTAGQRSLPVVLTFDVRPEAFPRKEADEGHAPQWAEESVLVLGPAITTDDTRFGDFEEAGNWQQALLLWHDDPRALGRRPSGWLENGIDVVCCYRRPGSNAAQAAVLAAGVTASRLQVALPSNVPMSLRLVLRSEPVDLTVAAKPSAKRSSARSDPLLLMMSDSSEHLRPTWEVWARQTVGGVPPRWTELPEAANNLLEASWLEEGNMAKVQLELADSQGCLLPPGHYEFTFGDERQIQHTVRRLGMGGWIAKARRSVRDPTGEDATLPVISAEECCIICMERRRTHAFMHADTGDGHLAVCEDCAGTYRAESVVSGAARQVRTCPVCRRGFSALQRIYH